MARLVIRRAPLAEEGAIFGRDGVIGVVAQRVLDTNQELYQRLA
jgi:hypothetical protein